MPAAVLLKCLAILAVLLMPLGLGHARAALPEMPSAIAAHCAGEGKTSGHEQRQSIDCLIACAALPALADAGAAPLRLEVTSPPLPLLTAHLWGLGHEAAIPPPRTA